MVKGSVRAAVLLLIAASLFGCDKESKTAAQPIVPKTEYPLPIINSETPPRIVDLSEIAFALERYKLDHRQYPVSSSVKNGFDGLLTDYGLASADWIPGLVPNYLDMLPADPRANGIASEQYYYRSNGANYKLIAHNPDDCYEVQKTHPELIDPVRNCWAYGFWTVPARNW